MPEFMPNSTSINAAAIHPSVSTHPGSGHGGALFEQSLQSFSSCLH